MEAIAFSMSFLCASLCRIFILPSIIHAPVLTGVQSLSPPLKRQQALLLLCLPIIHQPDFLDLITLGNDDAMHVVPLALDISEPPDLLGRPAGVVIDAQALDEWLASGAAALGVVVQQAVDQEGVQGGPVGRGTVDPAAAGPESAEHVVAVGAILPVQCAQLSGALDAAGGGLVDVDVRNAIGVLLHVQSDGSPGDGAAHHPANALQGEKVVSVIGKSFVLSTECGG